MTRYLAVEGIDGAGKSTVAKALATHLEQEGHEVTLVREPGGTPAGEAIREVLLGGSADIASWTEALLFAAARAQLAAEVVAPALAGGRVVVSDRCFYSSLAYQGAARGLGVEIVRTVNQAGLGGVEPDTVVLLRVPVDEGFAREDEADRISAEGVEFQHDVAAAYERLAEEEPDRFVVVDGSRPVSEIVSSVAAILEDRW